jgi:hypothetical protein
MAFFPFVSCGDFQRGEEGIDGWRGNNGFCLFVFEVVVLLAESEAATRRGTTGKSSRSSSIEEGTLN